MTRIAYYRVALAAPLIVPCLAGAVTFLAPSIFIVPGVILMGSLLYAGPAYAVFALGVLLWSRGKTPEALHRVGRFAPLLFAPLGGLSFSLMEGPASGLWRASEFLPNFLAGVVLVLVVGYLYVGAVLLFEPAALSNRVDG